MKINASLVVCTEGCYLDKGYDQKHRESPCSGKPNPAKGKAT